MPGNTPCLIAGECDLVRLEEIVRDKEMAARRNQQIEKAVKAMLDHSWDEKVGTLLGAKRTAKVKDLERAWQEQADA